MDAHTESVIAKTTAWRKPEIDFLNRSLLSLAYRMIDFQDQGEHVEITSLALENAMETLREDLEA
jgi:hypothetical protein